VVKQMRWEGLSRRLGHKIKTHKTCTRYVGSGGGEARQDKCNSM